MSKRGAVFPQGKAEDPYPRGDSDMDEPPQRATAAQMANRKIKSVKTRRTPGVSSGLSQSANFGQPQQPSAFNFGSSQPAGGDGSNPFAFQQQQQQSGGAFGSTTNSFPPAQGTTPSASFTNASFPAFGAGNDNNTGFNFNPQPPSSTFNFSAGTKNPFTDPAPTVNGSGASGFSGSIFNLPPSQPQTTNSNPFSGSIFAPQNTAQSSTTPQKPPPTNLFGGSTSTTPFGQPPAKNLFSVGDDVMHTSPDNSPSKNTNPPAQTPQVNAQRSSQGLFGTINSQQSLSSNKADSAPAATSTPAPVQQPLADGLFSQFKSQPQEAPTEKPKTDESAKPANPFASLLRPPQEKPAQSTSTLTAATEPSTTTITTVEEQPKKNPFASLPRPPSPVKENKDAMSQPGQGGFSFLGASTRSQSDQPVTQTASTSNAFVPNENASTPRYKPFGFAAATTAAQNSSQSALVNPFGDQTSGSTSKPATSLFDPFQIHAQAEPSTMDPVNPAPASTFFGTSGANISDATPKPSLFSQSSFGQSSSSANTSDATPKPSIFSQNAFGSASSSSNTSDTTPKPSIFSQNIFGQSAQTMPTLTGSTTPRQTDTLSSGLTNKTGSTQSGGIFNKSTTQVPTPTNDGPMQQSAIPPSSSSSVPASLGVVKVPDHWPKTSDSVPVQSDPPANLDDIGKQLWKCGSQLASLNEAFKAKINNCPPDADWSALSAWHYKNSMEVRKKIVTLKKQRAATMGVTGNESSLSTKRKAADDHSQEKQDTTPLKKAKADDAVNTPTRVPPQQRSPFINDSVTNTPAQDASQTSSIFTNILNKSTGTAPVMKDTLAKAPADTATSGFALKPSASTSEAPKVATTPSFQVPKFGAQSTDTTTGKSATPFGVPKFGGSSGGSSFMSQFAKGAKSAEELAAERKKKAKAAEYDSEEETEEEWSARYDAQEAEKKAEQEKKASGAPTFKLSAPSSNASSDAESGPKSVFGFPKPTASGASSNGLYGSRIGSPAPSTTGGASVFDSPHIGQTPASGNIFGHLPSGAESNGQDEESDEEEQEEEQSEQTGEQSQAEQTSDYAVPSSSSKRKFADSESDETLEETMRRRKQGRKSPSATEEGVSTPMPAKRDLFSRITRDPPAKDQSVSEKDEAEKDKSEEDAPSSDQSNGISKTPDKLYQPFDFSSASKGIGGASTGFNPSTSLGPVGGDQTYKQGSPIKFGQGVQNPVVNVQPSTPSPAELFGTPGAKFNFNTLGTTAPSFLTPSAGQSGVNSGVSSLFSSRAPTPSLSADETSGKESAAENENGEGDDPQLNLYKDLTPEEKEEWDILFHADAALAKHMVKEPDADGKDVKKWQNFARGPLWVLKNKNTGKALVRIRVSSGATPVNYFILPKVLSRPTGKMVFTPCTTKAGKPDSYYFAFRAPELAKEFSETYNGNLPS